jgi:hypothetical protein
LLISRNPFYPYENHALPRQKAASARPPPPSPWLWTARLGRRTLLVDLDPQGHVAFSLGSEKSRAFQLIVNEMPQRKVVVHACENLDNPPGDK